MIFMINPLELNPAPAAEKSLLKAALLIKAGQN